MNPLVTFEERRAALDRITEKVIGCTHQVSNNSAQCLNYLRGTDLNVCLLVNFASAKATVKRIVHNF